MAKQGMAWHEATQSIKEKSLTDHEPKGIRKYNGNHVNIATSVNRFRLSRKLEHGKTGHVGMFTSSMHSPQGIA